MKYLKLFQTQEEYDAFKAAGIDRPNVSYVKNNAVLFNGIFPPLYIEAVEDTTVTFSYSNIEYSLDNSTWEVLPAKTATPVITAGNKVYFRVNEKQTSSDSGIGTFSTTGKCNVGGNIMSMAYGEDYASHETITKNYQFMKLFKNARNLIDASKLVLPATTGYSCYEEMFYGCTSLTTAPELPATTLADNCYSRMFYGCTKLNYIKMLATDTKSLSLYNWVNGVAPTGTFVKNSEATWDVVGNSGVPEGWTVETAEA